MRGSRAGWLAALLLVDVVVATTAVGAARAEEDAALPSSLHGAVETQALTAGNGALALFVDPGTAHAYSTMDRDDYGGGSISYTMTARGANLNLGTIAYAVLWAAPDCSADGNYGCIASGGMGTPNTGLQEAAGFPLYAEALYPPPPEEDGESREYVYKCIVNKDAPGAAPSGGAANDVCKGSDSIPFASWAEAPGKELRSTGFSRVAGFGSPVASIGVSQSSSDVRYAGGGKLVSKGRSAINDISILDGQITIGQSSVAALVEAGIGVAPKRQASCTFSNMAIAGQAVSVDDLSNGDAQELLNGVRDATGYEVKIIPPVLTVEEGEAGKQIASCRGAQVFITDLHQGSPAPACTPLIDPTVPQCVPAAGNRIELTFGSISIQQSVNDLAESLPGLGDGIAPAPSDVGDTSFAPAPSDAGGDTSFIDEGLRGAPSLPAPTSSGGGEATTGGAGGLAVEGTQLASSVEGRNLGAIGALTAASTVALGAGVLLLISVVNALGTGGRIRFPRLW